jgi:carbamoyltransferase
MLILGLNIVHGDSAACLISDGRLLSAAEEERFVRIKHSSNFPINAINFCLKNNNVNIEDIDYITINNKLTYNFFNKLFFLFKNLLKFNFFLDRTSINVNKQNVKKKKKNIQSNPNR